MLRDRPPISSSGAASSAPSEAHAAEHLRFIREVMERSGTFTAVPGWGSVGMGATAVAAAVLAAFQPTPGRWLLVWLGCAGLAGFIGVATLHRKARASAVPLFSGAGRKYVLGLAPALAAGALLTVGLWQAGQADLLPGLWLLLYGAATVTGGAYSVRLIPIMGLSFMVLGALALFVSFTWANALLGLGFGGLHVGFGWIIATRYGG